MFSTVLPYQWVALRLPSDNIKVEQIIPKSSISLGKYGSFNANDVINRPYNITWEIVDKSERLESRALRLVTAAELHADTLLEEVEASLNDDDEDGAPAPHPELDDYGLIGTEKSNAHILDNPENQRLTMAEIEALKSDVNSNPRELIARIMKSHAALDQKTAFSLAKYTIRKQKKFLKRFTILPLDVSMMAEWMMSERDFGKVMEIRNEALGLLCSWANIHSVGSRPRTAEVVPECRYLVVDDTGGLVAAAAAERMGILHYDHVSPSKTTEANEADQDEESQAVECDPVQEPGSSNRLHQQPKRLIFDHALAQSNTITLVQPNSQGNLSLLRYFNFDPNLSPSPHSPDCHPLHTHLKTISWLQLLEPTSDSAYQEPPFKSDQELSKMKSNARSTYHRKRRRWERCKSIVDETRSGGFDGLIIASHMNSLSILHRLVPLLAGGAQIAIYSPHVEPLTEIYDAYSTARRNAFLAVPEDERENRVPSEDFPVDPTLTLGFMVQTARVRKWQVLPGRTHPLMMGRGGAEGYVAVATRVLPLKGDIRARGKSLRKPKRTLEAVANGAAQLMVENEDEEMIVNTASDSENGGSKRLRVDESHVADEDSDLLAEEAHETSVEV